MIFKEIPDLIITLGFSIFLVLAIYTTFALMRTNKELVRARAFLKKDFIIKNLIYVTIAGSLLAIHEFIEMLIQENILSPSFSLFSESIEALSLIFLLLWMLIWHGLR